jgi:hypothetical protein
MYKCTKCDKKTPTILGMYAHCKAAHDMRPIDVMALVAEGKIKDSEEEEE